MVPRASSKARASSITSPRPALVRSSPASDRGPSSRWRCIFLVAEALEVVLPHEGSRAVIKLKMLTLHVAPGGYTYGIRLPLRKRGRAQLMLSK
jgi:hypothetical protein